MPPRLALTGGDYEAHVKAQAVVRNRRYRERLRERRSALREQQAVSGRAAHGSPPTPPVVSPTSKEVEEVEGVLAPFAERGYEHDARWWQRLAQRCPDVDLYLECSNLAEWLLMPVHRKEECSKRRIGRWMRKAQADADAGKAAPAPVPARGVVVNGTWHPPAAFQRNPGPPPEEAVPLREPLQTFTREELARLREEHARVPFKDKLAAKAALATNGIHK